MLSFLPRRVHLLFILAPFFFYLFEKDFLAVLVLLFYAFLFYLFRAGVQKTERLSNSAAKLVLSPCNGKVISVKSNVTHPDLEGEWSEVRIAVPWKREYGIYSPQSVEIVDVRNYKGRSIDRFSERGWKIEKATSYSGILFKMRSRANESFVFQTVTSYWSFLARLWLLPGDRAGTKALLGYFPFGGTLLIYLPINYEILVNKGVTLEATETLIAGERKQA